MAPGRLPLLGHLPALVRNPIGFLHSLTSGPEVTTIYIGTRPMYVANTLDLVYEMLVTRVEDYRRGIIFEKAEKVLGKGLTVLEGDVHKKQRKMIQPALTQRQIAGYTQAMVEVAEARASAWQPGVPLDANEELHDLGMELFSRALFRAEFAVAATERVKKATPAFMAGIIAHSLYPAQWMEKLPIGINRRFNVARPQMESAVNDVIARYRGADVTGAEDKSILAMLMAAVESDTGQRMDDGQLRDEVVNLVVAGAEAPGTTLAWFFHEVAQHPEIEKRMVAEIDEVLGTDSLTVENLMRLEYTTMMVKETLRLHTPTWLLTRRAGRDLELGGYRIPGTVRSRSASPRSIATANTTTIPRPSTRIDGATRAPSCRRAHTCHSGSANTDASASTSPC